MSARLKIHGVIDSVIDMSPGSGLGISDKLILWVRAKKVTVRPKSKVRSMFRWSSIMGPSQGQNQSKSGSGFSWR